MSSKLVAYVGLAFLAGLGLGLSLSRTGTSSLLAGGPDPGEVKLKEEDSTDAKIVLKIDRREELLPRYDVDFESCFANCRNRNIQRGPPAAASVTCNPRIRSDGSPVDWGCDASYSPKNVTNWCSAVCANQFPGPCDKAKYLIVYGDSWGGLGWRLYPNYFLTFKLAMLMGRILIFNNSGAHHRSQWSWSGDAYLPCAQGELQACYFAPITNCTLPDDWFGRALHVQNFTRLQNEFSDQEPIPLMDAHPLVACNISVLEYKAFIHPNRAPHRERKRYLQFGKAKMSSAWFKNQMAAFMLRPNRHTMYSSVFPLLRRTFGDVLIPSEKFISVFMRNGDKSAETLLFSSRSYWESIAKRTTEMNINLVYLGSDSARTLNETLQLASTRPELRIAYIPYPRYTGGLHYSNLTSKIYHHAAVRDLVTVALTDLFISTHASLAIGTLTSSWCMVQDRVRSGNGRWSPIFDTLDWCGNNGCQRIR